MHPIFFATRQEMVQGDKFERQLLGTYHPQDLGLSNAYSSQCRHTNLDDNLQPFKPEGHISLFGNTGQ